MAKYASFFSYSSETWARMINSPGDRSAALRQVLDVVGGSLESIHWMFGPYDGIAILQVPDSISAAAVSVAVGSTGTFKHLETHELFTQDQLSQTLAQAKNVTRTYQPPGQQG
ncbi:MAG TPA: GYD domain-containing protein [Streptosporangiaceae bacterium]|nr:GYD domain-containing protein [Streptosporangiaceae bacterium]